MLLGLAGCATNRYDRTAGEVMDDRRLEVRVERALERQPVYKYPNIDVHTYRGVVQLSGFVATEAQKEAATEIAKRVRGVAQVENNILIAPLEQERVRDYIPGREEDGSRAGNSVKDSSSGAAPSSARSSTGAVTNSPAR